MTALRRLKTALIGLAGCGMLAPESALQAASPRQETAVRPQAPQKVADVALRTGGVLMGQVTDPQGIGLGGVDVSVHQGSRQVARAVTDEHGRFVVKNLRGGVYQISAAQGTGHFRLWAAGVEPPSAAAVARVVSDPAVVRGQNRSRLVPPWRNVAFGAAIAATGYGLYRWIDNTDDEDRSMSDPLN